MNETPDDAPSAEEVGGGRDRRIRDALYFGVLLLVCAVAHVNLVTRGWNLPLLGPHDFRQTQTALTSYWAIREGFRLDYITPVCGPPWSIPLEFPLYQWIVALVNTSTGYPLDQAGRLVSLLFFYLALPPAFLLGRRVLKRTSLTLFFICLLLINPIHIFWGRTFLIETTVLCFGSYFLWFFVRALERRRLLDHVLAVLFGCLAALVKPTTYAVFLVAAFCFYTTHFVRDIWPRRSRRTVVAVLLQGAILTLISIAATWLWTNYCDGIKAAHPYTPLVSADMHAWNYGTLGQRLTIDNWTKIFFGYNGFIIAIAATLGLSFATFLAGGAVAVWLLIPGYRRIGLAALLTAAVGPMVFFNLFTVHSYYQMAITWCLCLFAVLPFAALMSKPRLRFVTQFGLVPIFLCGVIGGYVSTVYYTSQSRPMSGFGPFLGVMHSIEAATDQDQDAILVFALEGWNSKYAYYSRRKCFATADIPTLERLRDDTFKAMEKAMKEDGMRFRAVVTIGEARQLTPDVRAYLDGRFNSPGMTSVQTGPVLLFDAKPIDPAP
ncbi:MAG: glycosyltransferase family 39 protein [Lentisphaerae bacterium]|nr:glycosyltransferase family 39 protein [Lentisphaerota bacterium]